MALLKQHLAFVDETLGELCMAFTRNDRRRRLSIAVLLGTVGFLIAACSSPAAAVPTAGDTVAAPKSNTPPPAPATPTVVLDYTQSGSVEIGIVELAFQPPQSWHFDPAAVKVRLGAKVTWTNSGAVLHTVTADNGNTFNSGDMQAKATYGFTPTSAGTVTYHCVYHPWMTGTVIVQP